MAIVEEINMKAAGPATFPTVALIANKEWDGFCPTCFLPMDVVSAAHFQCRGCCELIVSKILERHFAEKPRRPKSPR